LQGLYRKNEDAFTSLALEKGLIMDGKKKMDAMQVEATISEAELCKNNSRILFRHLSQFFGRNFVESEHKRQLF
jgi:hypothetical protein